MDCEKRALIGTLGGNVIRGYSAYQVAVRNGFEGTEKEWLESIIGQQGEKGDTGDSGVHVGTDAPTDPVKNVWIDIDGAPDEPFSGLKYVKDDPSDNGGVIEGLVALPTDVTLDAGAKTNIASGENSHAEGGFLAYTGTGENRIYHSYETLASGKCAHAEGGKTSATTDCAHAEGYGTVASGIDSHAEGYYGVSSGTYSHAEGYDTTASGNYGAHAEGHTTTAGGAAAHAEGGGTFAGDFAHAEGADTRANNYCSHSEGLSTLASSDYQHVQGKYNVEDSNSTYAHIVGGGADSSHRANIHTLDWSGNAEFAGKVTAGAQPTADNDLATKKYVDNAIAALLQQLGGGT